MPACHLVRSGRKQPQREHCVPGCGWWGCLHNAPRILFRVFYLKILLSFCHGSSPRWFFVVCSFSERPFHLCTDIHCCTKAWTRSGQAASIAHPRQTGARCSSQIDLQSCRAIKCASGMTRHSSASDSEPDSWMRSTAGLWMPPRFFPRPT